MKLIMRNKKQLIPHYDNNGVFLGNLDISESLSIRCEVLKYKHIGYYIIYDNIKVYILSDGTLDTSIKLDGLYENKKKSIYSIVKHSIKREYQQFRIRTHKNVNRHEYIAISEYEKEIVSICKNMVNNKNSELLLCPKTFKRYINNDELGMYIIIKEKTVDIINHTYHYNEYICVNTMMRIKRIFDGHVEKRRQDMETEIFSNVKNTLTTINNKLFSLDKNKKVKLTIKN